MSRDHRKGIYLVCQFICMIVVSIYAAGCSDAASKASSKQPALSVLDIFPADGAKSIPINTAITAVFNQNLDATTVTGAAFTVRGNSKAVAGEATFKNMRVQFTPAAALLADTEYSVEIATAIKSQGGQALGKSVSWKFVTGPFVDSTSPTVVDTQPAADASGVSMNSKIIATFSERIQIAAVTNANFSVKRGDVVVAGAVQASDFALSFSPSAALQEEAVYTVTVQGVMDLAGNSLAATKLWSFTAGKTPDTVAPMLVSSLPPSGAESLTVATSIALQFSEALDLSTIAPGTIALSTSGVVTFTAFTFPSNDTVVITPQNNLIYGATYTLTLDGVTDTAGNRLTPVTLSYKTEADSDGDLMPDSWEQLKGTDPAKADASDDPDNDKLVNLDEFRHGADPKNADTDGDGASDGEEILLGRNPLVNEPSVLAVIYDLLLSD